MREDYVPQDDGNLALWAKTLHDAAGQAGNRTAMGWDVATGDAVEAAAQRIADAVAAKAQAWQEYLAAIAAEDAIIATALGLIRPAVASGKNAPTATEAIQLGMGLLGPEATFDPDTYVPPFRELALAGPAQVRVKFGKGRRRIDGVKVFMRRNGGAWIEVRFATISPCLDTTPLAVPGVPELREYRIRGVLKDVEIGLFSNVKTVLVS